MAIGPPDPGAVRPAPRINGMTDYYLGGSTYLRADREFADKVAARFPAVPGLTLTAWDFRLRTARWLAREHGIRRFLRAWAPAYLQGRSFHDAAREEAPGAEVLYVSSDQDTHDLLDGLLHPVEGVGAVMAASTAELLQAPPVKAWLAGGEPVALVTGNVLHLVSAAQAEEDLAVYASVLPPGSWAAVSGLLPGDPAEFAELAAMFAPVREVRAHAPADIARWMKGFDLVPPGVADVRMLPERAGSVAVIMPGSPGWIGGAVGRVR
jgi:S-adenosyl methyltransferase